MVRLFFVLLMCGILVIGCNSKKNAQHDEEVIEDHKSEVAVSKQVYYYTCPMDSHKHVHSNLPGNCSECSMNLVAAEEATADSAQFYGCPMESHSNVRTNRPGDCEECGMELKPMKLKSNMDMGSQSYIHKKTGTCACCATS
jgi:hypothetical protein